MEQIDRIREMEARLDRAAAVLEQAEVALSAWEAAQEELQVLAAYYESPLWREDFESDEQGLLPKELPRGVLSEDAVYDLLERNAALPARWNGQR